MVVKNTSMTRLSHHSGGSLQSCNEAAEGASGESQEFARGALFSEKGGGSYAQRTARFFGGLRKTWPVYFQPVGSQGE
jgi:hypothetical protein